MDSKLIDQAREMAKKVTDELGGAGIFGVEFFVSKDKVIFSELSPRPHDTGMVTLGHTQTYSEFELHARAVLHLPIPKVELQRAGASAVVLAPTDRTIEKPDYTGVCEALKEGNTDVRIFGKPRATPGRRMGVLLHWADSKDADVDKLKDEARRIADKISVVEGK